ncbi:MAG: ABC transporter ATP-binding protein [Gammaproteobacteria bacterium]
MASVEFKNISKRFENGTVALKNFNLCIEDGEHIVLVVASGCGKSTALRLLAGLETPSEGEVLIDKKVVNVDTPQQRNVAMVFQNYALYPHMTVRGNLEFPLKMSHTAKDQVVSRVANIAGLLGLSDLMGRRPAQLSGGQRQRVAMGRALVRDPSVFLLDEPLSNLDAKLRAQIRADIAKIQQRLKKTTLYVTHDQVEAMTLGDRIAVLNNGELQQIGTPEKLYKYPANIFVAKFIGSPGMNILHSRITDLGSDHFGVQLGDSQITLKPSNQLTVESLSHHASQKVLVGIRPEAFSITSFEGGVCIKLKVNAVEYLGHESLVYLDFTDECGALYGDSLIARLPGHYTYPSDNMVNFYIDPEVISIFDEAEQSIF